MRAEWKRKHPMALELNLKLNVESFADKAIAWIEQPYFNSPSTQFWFKLYIVYSTLLVLILLFVFLSFVLLVIKWYAPAQMLLTNAFCLFFLPVFSKIISFGWNERALTIKYNRYIDNLWRNVSVKYKYSRVRYINWRWKNEWVPLDNVEGFEIFNVLQLWRFSTGRCFFQTLELYFLDLTVYWVATL